MIIGNAYWHFGFKPVTVTVTIYHFGYLWIFWAFGLEFMQTLTFYFHVHGSLWRCLSSMFLLSGAICGRRSETVTHFTQHSTTLCRPAMHKSRMVLHVHRDSGHNPRKELPTPQNPANPGPGISPGCPDGSTGGQPQQGFVAPESTGFTC